MSDREAFEKWVCDLNRAPTAWEAWQAALQHPQPAVPVWVEGQPEIDKIAVLHIPLRGYPEHCLIGYVTEYGDVVDMCGDTTGCTMEDVSRWADISFLLSAGKEGE
jgi:hypothetical protein